jgi:hypothetical protein
MFKNIIAFLTNFHKPFVETLNTWYFLIDQDTELCFTMFFWDELNFFSPSEPNAEDFFEWYGYILTDGHDEEDDTETYYDDTCYYDDLDKLDI